MNPETASIKGAELEESKSRGAHSATMEGDTHVIVSISEKKLLRKLDVHIVPVIMLLYLFSFLDRTNIGNAKLYGMIADLDLTGNKYQLAVSLLFATYLLFEVPSNLLLKKLRPSRFLAAITTTWGIIATLTGLCHNFPSLIVCRLLLGMFEAGLFPGLTVYLTFFYTRQELALRIGFIFISAAIAGAFGGLLAYAIGFMEGVAGLHAWRWIFIIEGIPAFLMGIATYFLLPDTPETAYFLTPEERNVQTIRLYRQVGHTIEGERFHWKDVRAGALDWRTWVFAAAQFGVNTMWYGFSTFLPTIIQGIGSWTTAQIQLLTIPCYCLGAVTYLVVSHLSDRQGRRAIYTIGFGAISMIGYGLMLSNASYGVHYLGCFLIAMGLYVAVGLPLAWLPNNLPRYSKRAFSSGFQLTIGSFGGITAPFLFTTAGAPKYVLGQATSLALLGLSLSLYAILWAYYTRANKHRKAGREDYKMEGKTEFEINEMGDDS